MEIITAYSSALRETNLRHGSRQSLRHGHTYPLSLQEGAYDCQGQNRMTCLGHVIELERDAQPT